MLNVHDRAYIYIYMYLPDSSNVEFLVEYRYQINQILRDPKTERTFRFPNAFDSNEQWYSRDSRISHVPSSAQPFVAMFTFTRVTT